MLSSASTMTRVGGAVLVCFLVFTHKSICPRVDGQGDIC
jgi:hypothetical protein